MEFKKSAFRRLRGRGCISIEFGPLPSAFLPAAHLPPCCSLGAAFTGLCWWFGTGVILWLDRMPKRSFRWSLLGWSGLLLLSLWGVHESMQSVSVGNAYLGFASVIVMWGWRA